MTRRSARRFGARPPLAVIAGAVFAIASTAACPGRPDERAAPETRAEEVAPTPTVPAMAESSATFEVSVAPSPTAERPVEAAPATGERPADTPLRCLTLQVSPSSASAYGISGEVVQLVVRAQNGCGTNFASASFRVTAMGYDGRPLTSAVGSFSSGIPPGGSAQTLIAIPTKPSIGITYRAEVTGY